MVANIPDVESIFYAAIDLATPEERGAYVQSTCGGNEELRQRVEKLLQAHFRADSFLDSPATTLESESDRSIQEGPGTVVGPYKLMEQIGEGGFGLVFVAEQIQPVKRKVALKVIKPGMDSKQVIARFEAERQALALMDQETTASRGRCGESWNSMNGLPSRSSALVGSPQSFLRHRPWSRE
jgi:serine/threonine protein kinase